MPDTHVSTHVPLESVRAKVSEAEWQARLDCAAAYRLMAAYGMSDLIYNHITVRIPGEQHHILINPYGWLYEEITASSLVTIDLEGNTIFNPHPDLGINRAGYVIHTHTRAGMAVSVMKCGLLPMTQTAMRCLPAKYHAYEGPALDLDERARLVDDLGDGNFMILHNHGLLTCGPTVAEAWNAMYWLEMACKAQVDAMAANTELTYPGQDVIDLSMHQYKPATRRPYGVLEWPAMLRFLDRRDPSWRN